jgi:putative endonuclease
MLLRFTRATVRTLDALARLLRRGSKHPEHLQTGRRGEEDAYFHLRRNGYTIVARNFRSPRRRGEIDLIAYEDGMLCFIEVKTRTTRDVKPAEAAVDQEKRRELAAVAHEYLRRLEPLPSARFDVVSVYRENGSARPEITVFKGAFALQ